MKKINLTFILVLICGLQMTAQDIFQAARDNDSITMEKILAEDGELNQANNRGFTPLILAVYNESYEVARLLLEKGANPDTQDLSGNTALMGAAF